jgi:hypothetical protein
MVASSVATKSVDGPAAPLNVAAVLSQITGWHRLAALASLPPSPGLCFGS